MPTFKENYGKYVASSFGAEFYLNYDALKDILSDVKEHGLTHHGGIMNRTSTSREIFSLRNFSYRPSYQIAVTSDDANADGAKDALTQFENFYFGEFNKEIVKTRINMDDFCHSLTLSLINEESQLSDEILEVLERERKANRHKVGRCLYSSRKAEIQSLYKQAEALQILRELNVLMAIRIMKKHDRILSKYGCMRASFALKESPDFIYIQDDFKAELDDLKFRIKKCFARLSCNGDIDEAEHKLNILKDRTNSPKMLLTSGVGGIIVMLTFWFIWDYVLPPDAGYSLYNDPVLYVYGFVGNLIVYKSLWAIQIYVWDVNHINYSYLLEMKDKQAPDYINIFYHTAVDFVLFFFNIIFYVRSRRGHADPKTFGGLYFLSFLPSSFFPLCLIVIFFMRQIKDFIYGGNHHAIFTPGILKAVVLSPFTKVSLKESFAGDFLTSLSRVMYNGAYTSCYVLSGAIINDPTTSNYSLQSFGVCSRTNVLIILNGMFFVFPFLFRFFQCIRQIYETTPPGKLLSWPQSANALKYIFSIIMTLMQILRPINFNRPIFASLNLTALVTLTLYTTFWDIIMDWGLLQRGSSVESNNCLLREKLMFAQHKYFYYVAMFMNFLLRTVWVTSVIPSTVFSSLSSSSYSFVDMVYPFLAIIEQLRRTMWGILRIEYEHITVSEKTSFSSLLKNLALTANNMKSAGDVESTPVEPFEEISGMMRLQKLATKRRQSVYIPYALHETEDKTNASTIKTDKAQGNFKAAIFHILCGFFAISVVVAFYLSFSEN